MPYDTRMRSEDNAASAKQSWLLWILNCKNNQHRKKSFRKCKNVFMYPGTALFLTSVTSSICAYSDLSRVVPSFITFLLTKLANTENEFSKYVPSSILIWKRNHDVLQCIYIITRNNT
jgi:hypothetical protein